MLLPLLALALISCNPEELSCLENKEVIIQSVNPSITFCSSENNETYLTHKWDTSYSSILSECDAQHQLTLLKASWQDLVAHHHKLSLTSEQDSIFLEYLIQYPASYNILDSGF